jgi:hypothetical protein
MFNEYFASIFMSDSDSNSERRDHSHVITIDNVTLSKEEVMTVIMNLDSNKAQGPDNIPARFLKETAMQITPSLCALFNKSPRVGAIPRVWEATDQPLPVTSGVPQVSILGPLLFLLYENHLPNAVTSSNIATFADDTRIFETINSISDGAALQGDLSKLEEGSTNVNLELNVSKCKVMRVTRKHNKIIYPYTARSMYMLHDTIIESTGSERDLGILTSYSLTCRAKHVEYQCAKASNTLGYIRRSPFDIKDIAVRRTLYLTLIRTQLCYGSQIWAPQTVNLSNRETSTTRDRVRLGSTLPL